MIKTLCFINQKGGIGKSSLCIWMASWLEKIYKSKKKIIILDLDFQPATTKYMYGNPMNFNSYSEDFKEKNICSVLEGKISAKDAIISKEVKMPSRKGNIDYIFGSKSCTENYFLNKGINIFNALSALLNELEELGYDFVLIDCHPSASTLEDSVITLSDMCIIPAIPELIELSGMTDMMNYCAQIPASKGRRIDAVILNRCENKMVHKGIMRACQAFIDNPDFNGYFFKTAIESCTFVSQAVDRNILLPYFKPHCKTSQQVKSAVEEIIELFRKMEEGEL